MLALRGVLSSTDDDESKKHASGTLLVLERTITPEMESSYEILHELLTAVNPSRCDQSPSPPSCNDVDDDNTNSNTNQKNRSNNSDGGSSNGSEANHDGACSELSDVVNATEV